MDTTLGIEERHLLNPQDLNRYAYVANNPLKYIDPDGLERIQVIVTTFIPMDTVTFMGRTFNGDGRNAGEPGSYKSTQTITIETDPSKNGGSPLLNDPNSPTGRDTGITYEFDKPGGTIIGKGQASGETLTADVMRDAAGAVQIHATGNEANPLVSGGPGITYNFNITVQSSGPGGDAVVNVTGNHDKFPGYEIVVSRPELPKANSTVVYQYDPRPTNQTPAALFPFKKDEVIEKPVESRIPPK